MSRSYVPSPRLGKQFIGHQFSNGQTTSYSRCLVPKILDGQTDDERMEAAREFMRRTIGLAMSRDDCGDDPEAERAARAEIDRKQRLVNKRARGDAFDARRRRAEIERIQRRVRS